MIALRDGPFRQLDGTWQFRALEATASKVELELEYAFAAAALERVVGPVFSHIAHTLVDAFVRRAETVYGT